MKSKTFIVLTIMVIGALLLACNLLTTPSVPPEDVQPPLPADVPDEPPVTEPLPETSNLPAGLGTARENTVAFFDLNGTQISQVELPQNTFLSHDRTHIAGTVPASGWAVPLLYFSYEDGEALLFRDGVGQIFALQNGTSFLGLTGVPGKPLVAFSQIEYLDLALRSKIYVGSIQTLPSAAPISVIDDPESWAIKPILVQAENDTPTQVWYTRIAYGIGGDIVFEPRKGLFVLDIATGQATTILDNNLSPWAISDDKEWVAFSAAGSQNNSMCVKNLGTRAELCFPALPASEPRGAGNAFLSPDAQYLAWMEADGWLMAEVPSFVATVRVGQNNNAMVADLPMDTFESVAGIGAISRAEPVAWLDNQTVIIQVRGQEWDQASLLGYNVTSGETSYLAPGAFVGLLYP